MVMICDDVGDDDDVACFFLFCQHHSCIMLLHCYFVYLRCFGALVNLFSIRFIGTYGFSGPVYCPFRAGEQGFEMVLQGLASL